MVTSLTVETDTNFYQNYCFYFKLFCQDVSKSIIYNNVNWGYNYNAGDAYIKLIRMQNSNALLYHDHILSNIQGLDKRKDGFIGHRLQFISECCLPAIKEDIKFYENMRDTQYQVIEAEPDIMQLKKEIADYKSTNQYYDSKLEEFDRFIAQLQVHLKNRRQVMSHKRQEFKGAHNDNGDALSTIRSRVHVRESSLIHNSKVEHRYSQNGGQSLQNSRKINNSATILDNSLETSENHKLPAIDAKGNVQNYHLTLQEKQLKRHARNQGRLQRIIRDEMKLGSLRESMIGNPEKQQIQLKTDSIKDIKQAITQFDHTEALFRQCFERKKLSVQKSVSQLDSKLISNKQLFLNACEVIGQKTGTLSYEDFSRLSTDETITLFISFSWLSRKIYGELAQKRKDIMGILKIIKSVEQQK